MDEPGNTLEARVRELLAHLEDSPAVAAVLPFTVDYLVARLREAVRPGGDRHPGVRFPLPAAAPGRAVYARRH